MVTAGLDPRMAELSSILVPNGDAQQPEMSIRLLDTWLCATPLGSIFVRCIFHPRVKTRGYPSVTSSRSLSHLTPPSTTIFQILCTTSPTPTFQKQCFWAHRHFLCVKICKSLGLFGVSSCTLRIFFVTLHQQTRGNGEGKSARQKDRSRCSSSA